MADDVQITAGSGTPVATDDCSGRHVQIMKLAYSADGDATQAQVDADGVLVNLGTNNDVTISGTVAVTQSGTWDEVGINDSGNSITVDAPAGTPVNVQIGDGTRQATVRDTGASDSLNVAIVDASGNQITSFGGGTEFAEDSAHSTGHNGTMILGVRNDANTARSDTDGDYTPIGVSSAGHVMTYRMADLQRISVQSGGLTTTATAYTAGDQVGTQFTLANAARISGGGGMIVGVQLISAADTIGTFDVVFFDSSVTLASDNAAFAISDADSLKIVALVNLAGAYDIGNNRIAQAFNLAVPYVCSGSSSLYAALIARTAISGTPFAATTDIQLITYVERY